MKRVRIYPNLEAEISRAGYNRKTLSEKIGISQCAMSAKLAGENRFSLSQIIKIKEALSYKGSIEQLFIERSDICERKENV